MIKDHLDDLGVDDSIMFGFLNGATLLSWAGLPHYGGFTITLRLTTLDRTPLDG
jgi:hypothetical protein